MLLQREDYVVRHLDTDGGGEVWKVEVGRFSPLDFDGDAHHQSNAHPSAHIDDVMEDSVVAGGRRRGAAAAAAAIGTKNKHRSDLPPILGGARKKFSSHKDEPDFESDRFNYRDSFNHEHTNFRAFPSIAFGEVRFAADQFSACTLFDRVLIARLLFISLHGFISALYALRMEQVF